MSPDFCREHTWRGLLERSMPHGTPRPSLPASNSCWWATPDSSLIPSLRRGYIKLWLQPSPALRSLTLSCGDRPWLDMPLVFMQRDKRQRTTRTTMSRPAIIAKKAGGWISLFGSDDHKGRSIVHSPQSTVQDWKTPQSPIRNPQSAIRNRFPTYAWPLESSSNRVQSSRDRMSSCVKRWSRRSIHAECGFSRTYAYPPYSGLWKSTELLPT